jgi:hypothetical protein
MIHIHRLREEIVDIWMMNEYGVEESWTKQFAIGPLLPVELPLHGPWLDCWLRLGRQNYLLKNQKRRINTLL